ncbi:hypothetical protein [Streptomyces cellulosae]|uniref:Uncharacterized protein n=1 Tax=Streptomyces cellulosae TaxID=1968 RepID=A0ABW7XWP5_STRCE
MSVEYQELALGLVLGTATCVTGNSLVATLLMQPRVAAVTAPLNLRLPRLVG